MPEKNASPFPTLKLLGSLEPDAQLLALALAPGFELKDFEYGAAVTAALKTFLAGHGYEKHEYESCGLLFASDRGVSLHTDERPSALWVLGGQVDASQETHQLLCGDQSALLSPGEVYLFDATKRHGVIANEHGLWVVFSVYVQPAKPSAVAKGADN
jgi:quercetin dioxygenase-like cupin family protein